MEREIYERLSTKCYCPECEKENCIHREAYRRLPEKVGGLGLCPNLQTNKN